MDVSYPEGTSAPKHQVAGHIHGQGKTKLGKFNVIIRDCLHFM